MSKIRNNFKAYLLFIVVLDIDMYNSVDILSQEYKEKITLHTNNRQKLKTNTTSDQQIKDELLPQEQNYSVAPLPARAREAKRQQNHMTYSASSRAAGSAVKAACSRQSFPAHIRWLTPTCNPSCRGSNFLFCLPRGPRCEWHILTQKVTHTHKKN